MKIREDTLINVNRRGKREDRASASCLLCSCEWCNMAANRPLTSCAQLQYPGLKTSAFSETTYLPTVTDCAVNPMNPLEIAFGRNSNGRKRGKARKTKKEVKTGKRKKYHQLKLQDNLLATMPNTYGNA